jgi:esterase FrsA
VPAAFRPIATVVKRSSDLKQHIRTWPEVRERLLERAGERRNPFDDVPLDRARAVLDTLEDVERDRWATAFVGAGEPFYARAAAAETAGDPKAAAVSYRDALGLFRVARYPAPNSPMKRLAYRRSQDAYLKLAQLSGRRFERVEIPYVGLQAPGTCIPVYVWRPERSGPLPVIVSWGGIDSFKEERRPEAFLAAGYAFVSMDMPGVGEAPIAGSEHGEELWNGVFDWIDRQPYLDAKRIVLHGGSTGGYWATKLAHTHRERILASVNHGGPAHYAFQADWIARSASGEYPFELAETLACAFGRETAAEWVAFAPALSLLDQGILDRPCAPLLCINGLNDSVFPIADMHVLTEHGSPKTVRIFPSGHMGPDPQMMPTIMTWIAHQLVRTPD